MPLDFNKIKEKPETNKLYSENQNVIFRRIEPKVLVEAQYYSAARSIEMIDRIRSGARDITDRNTVNNIKGRLIHYEDLTDEESDGEYDNYLTEMERFGLTPVMTKEEFLFYRDNKNIDQVIPDVLEMFGLEQIDTGE